MNKKRIYESMRKPTKEEHNIVYKSLYKYYNGGMSFWKIICIVTVVAALLVLVVALVSPSSVNMSPGEFISITLVGFIPFYIMHYCFAGCKRYARAIKRGDFKVADCVAKECKRLDYYNGDFASNSPMVQVVIGNVLSPWFDISCNTEKRLKEDASLPLLLVSNGKEWRVIPKDGDFNDKTRSV